MLASWADNEPDGITWKREYRFSKWNRKIIFTFTGRELTEPYSFDYQGEIRSLSLMKSDTQKAYRRCLTDHCLSSFKVLCGLNPKAALRRLGVIVIEDSLITYQVNTLIWLLMTFAFFDFPMDYGAWEWVYQLIISMCRDFKFLSIERGGDHLWKEDHHITIDGLLEEVHKDDLSSRHSDILLSLLFFNDRGVFTLESDKKLGGYYIKRFLDDWKESRNLYYDNHLNEINVNLEEIPYLKPDEILYIACDHHCDKFLVTKICKEFNLDDIFVRKLIWYSCSRHNVRQRYDLKTGKISVDQEFEDMIKETYGEIWIKVKKRVYEIMKKSVTTRWKSAR